MFSFKRLILSFFFTLSFQLPSKLLKQSAFVNRFSLLFPPITDDKAFNVGHFTDTVYKGTWNSPFPTQSDYIQSNTGTFKLAFNYDLSDPKKLYFIFEFFEGSLIENRNMITALKLDLESNTQTHLTGVKEDAKFAKDNKIFSNVATPVCKVEATIDLRDDHGNPLDITTNTVNNVNIIGSIRSEDCKVNLDFNVFAGTIEIMGVLVFMLLQIVSIVFGFYPLYKALKENNLSAVGNIGGSTFLGNIVVDMVLISINMTFGMRILPSYFEFFTLITMFFMISILFKIRFYIHIFETRLAMENFDDARISRLKFNFLMKFIIVSLVSVILADFFIIYYYLFFLIFLYPLFQIKHNCYNVIRKNCYRHDLHLLLVLPQTLYPLGFRFLPFSFFQLKLDNVFGVGILVLVVLQLIVMGLQKIFGPVFFLPRCLIPDYFNYFKKLKNLEEPGTHNCPICFVGLDEAPEEGAEAELLPTKYMETPCKHKFHEGCLKLWMEQKLMCPCCRTKIPPY